MTAEVAKFDDVMMPDEGSLSKSTTRQDTDETVATSASAPSLVEDAPMSDEDLLREGVRLCQDDQILPGCRLLLKVRDKSLFNKDHNEFIRRYFMMVKLREELTAPVYQGWTKQGESHGHRDFIVYYMPEEGGKLKFRIESVIESSLFVPFLAVMNETDLYETWFPSWTFPFKLGIHRSKKLKQCGRVEQVVQVTVDLPYPMRKREFVFWGFAEGDLEVNLDVGAKIVSVDESFEPGLVPPPEADVVRMIIQGDLLFRSCPDDHPALLHSKSKYPDSERKLLLTTVMFCDPKVNFLPQRFLNFVTRYAIGGVWRMILHISEEVRDGKRPVHSQIIAEKKEFYDWVESRSRAITGLTESQQLGNSN